MNIYDKSTTDFNNNGIGFLTDVISSPVTDILNGEYSVSMEYLNGGKLSEYLIEENIIKVQVEKDNYQPFRIKTVQKTTTKIKIYAVHLFYDLKDNFIEDTYPTDKNCHDAAEWVLNHTQYSNPFTVESTIDTLGTARYVRKNPVEVIMGDIDNSILKIYNAEIERDKYNIKLVSKRGSDNKVKLLFGKNIKEITINIDSSTIATKIMPIAYNGLLLPELYVDSPVILNYPKPKIATYDCSDIKVDPTDETAFATNEEAFIEMRNRVSLLYSEGLVDQPTISIKIDWVELSKTKEYYDKYQDLEKVRVGDVITCQIYGLNYKTRCIKTIYNPLTDRVDTFEIGTAPSSFIYTTTNQIKSISDKVNEVNPTNILEQAKNDATSLITTAMGGYVYKTNNELFIMNTDNPATASNVWRWNLNGLGYSTTGINGEYGIAITSGGEIVADFITAGHLSIGIITGLQDIINGITTQISLNQNDIQFIIPQVNNIIENGTAKLINTLVEINDDGIAISKDGEEMSLKLGYFDNNKMGLQVNRDNEEMLGVDNTGVRAINIWAKKYLVIGANSRMEDYQDGTGIFYIGS